MQVAARPRNFFPSSIGWSPAPTLVKGGSVTRAQKFNMIQRPPSCAYTDTSGKCSTRLFRVV